MLKKRKRQEAIVEQTSSGVKVVLILNNRRTSADVLSLIMLAIVLHVTSISFFIPK